MAVHIMSKVLAKAFLDRPNVTVVDIGTTQSGAMDVSRKSFSVIGSAGQSSRHEYVYGRDDLRRMFSADMVEDGVAEALKRRSKGQGGSAGIVVTGMMHGAVLAERGGKLLHGDGFPFQGVPIWNNGGFFDEAVEISTAFGMRVANRFSICPALHAIRNGIGKRIWKVMTFPQYLTYLLCGEAYTSTGGACGMVGYRLVNENSMMIVDSSLTKLNSALSSRFPTVVDGCSVVGMVTKAAADRFGLEEGMPVLVAGDDQICGMVLAGGDDSGTCMFQVGTSTVDMQSVDPNSIVPFKPGSDYFKMFGHVYEMRCSQNGTGEGDVLVQDLEPNLGLKEAHSKLTELGLAAAVDCGGILAFVHSNGENLLGGKVDHGNRWENETEASKTPGNIYRAFWQSIIGTDWKARRELSPALISVLGGASENPLVSEILSNLFGAKVIQRRGGNEGTALGAAVRADAGLVSLATGNPVDLKTPLSRIPTVELAVPARRDEYLRWYSTWSSRLDQLLGK